MGALGGEAQQHTPLPQPEPRAGLERSERGRASDGAEPLGHDVDLRGGRAEQLHEVAAGALGDRDHPLGAAYGERHQHPHAAVAQAGVRLGKARVDQVVDGHDPPEGPPRGRGGGERVHEVHPCARREHRQQGLLAKDPLLAAAGVDRHRYRRQQLAPGTVAGRGRLAVDEGREADLAARPADSGDTRFAPIPGAASGGEQRGQQLARADLHPPGLSWHEVDQVQTDVHEG